MEVRSLEVLILGCGFTGVRVARRLLAKGHRVLATARTPEKLAGLGVEILDVAAVPARLRPGTLVVHSVPPEGPSGLLDLLGDKPARMVYLSSTAVYGAAHIVDQHTPIDPGAERARARIGVEQSIQSGSWSSLILRPAAIYGPGRGTHERVKRGEFNLSDNFISRIHVDDLAAHVEAALLSPLTGAFPVADEEPCTSREITEFCGRLLGLSVPAGSDAKSSARATGNRRVDGSAVRHALGIQLQYPSYRAGIPAALAESAQR